jgi:membrane-bound metal-dependent hydrolase YbcI (DUF457 family)
MFVGHMAVALGAKKVEPRAPLAALVAAAFGLDLLWPIFLLAGIEVVRVEPGNTAFTPLDFASYPWSHSLLMSLVWGAAAGALAARACRNRRVGLIIAAAVVSHWVLDVVTHRPDLPIWPGGPQVGLGLWNSIPATLVIEGAMFVAAIVLYTRAAPARDAVGRWAFGALMVLIGVVWATGPISTPPPNPTAIGAVGLVIAGLMVPWVMWIERHRTWRG